MKWIVIQVVAIAAVIVAAVVFGDGPTRARWGEPGVGSMWAAIWICSAASVAALLPIAATAKLAPSYLVQAVFGATAIRLLVTGGLAIGYQAAMDEHLPSLLTWLLLLYLPLLAVETLTNVMLVRSAQKPSPGQR